MSVNSGTLLVFCLDRDTSGTRPKNPGLSRPFRDGWQLCTQTMGDNQPGLCSESHTVSVDTSSLSIVVGHTINDMLRAYTTYSITVVAMSDVWGSIGNSEPITVITNQTSDFYK